MSIARHPRTDGLTERVSQTMQTLLRCYCAEFGFDWTSHLSMVEFYYNFSVNEPTTHSPFEVMYGYRPSTSSDRLLPMVGDTTAAVIRLILIANIRDVVNQLLKLSKERMTATSTRTASIFSQEILFIFRRKGYTSVHRNANALEIRNWVLTKLYLLRWVSTPISHCYLRMSTTSCVSL